MAEKGNRMACQFFTIAKKVVQGGKEIGDLPLPHTVDMPICKLGRKPDELNWAGKCNQTAFEGPCWFWTDEKGNKSVLEFTRYSLRCLKTMVDIV